MTAGQQEARPKWEERVVSRMADGPPWLQLPLCCLPPSSDYLDPPRGMTRRHMLACPGFALKKLLTKKGRTGRCGHHLMQTCQRWNQGPISPNIFFFTLRDVLRATPPTTFIYLLHALTPACQKNRGWGDLRSLFKILICHMEAAVSSSFIALSDVPFWTVKCVDFAECAQ